MRGKMRKAIFVVISLFSVLLISAQDLFLATPGDYAIYRYEKGLIGVAYFNPNLFRIRVRSHEGENAILDITHTGMLNGFRITEATIRYGRITENDRTILLEELQDIFERRAGIDNSYFAEHLTVNVEGKIGKEKADIEFDYWIPCLQMKIIWNKNGRSIFELVKFGRMKSDSDRAFYLFELESKPERNLSNTIDKSDLVNVVAEDFLFSIYSNWESDRDDYGSLRYRLVEFTGQDAVLLVEKVNLRSRDIYNPLFFIKYYLMIPDDTIIPNSVSIRNGKRIYVQYETYNPETKYITLHRNLISKNPDEYFRSIILATYKSLYEANRAYFDAIWDSIRKAGKES